VCFLKRLEGKVLFLTIAILWVLFLRKNTRMVDRMTDVNGEAAEIQNNFGFFKLCCNH